MSNLYGPGLSKIFDKIYQGFIDYEAEFELYANLCLSRNVKSILELGCGTGNLAKRFSKSFHEYLGLDFSEHMLAIAKEKFPAGNFMQGDMRNFSLDQKYDAALITGRSTSYLLSNQDFQDTLKSVHRALNPRGYLIFDCIDADKFIPYVRKNPSVTHKSKVENNYYFRTSKWHSDPNDNTIIHWKSSYYLQKDPNTQFLGKDKVTFKVFTMAEITTALNKAGYEVLSIFERTTYAFDTFVVLAIKME
ncbi:class I SAM-dependent DNA methyltransferase [Sediminicola sp. 1XM1-17]|uniref:class I SAM-dependent DNA methyltransferase n=1 Tax=Sediminicola sp. 1XM1-17 TaxID=3127702 RepID=UPI003077712F